MRRHSPLLHLTQTPTPIRIELLRLPPLLPRAANAALALHTLGKAQRWMEDVEHEHGHYNHNALECNKKILLADQMARPTLSQLAHTVHATPEDADSRESQRAQETLKLEARAERHEVRILVEG